MMIDIHPVKMVNKFIFIDSGPLLVVTSSLSSELEGDLLSCLSFFGIDYVILFLS